MNEIKKKEYKKLTMEIFTLKSEAPLLTGSATYNLNDDDSGDNEYGY